MSKKIIVLQYSKINIYKYIYIFSKNIKQYVESNVNDKW